MVSGASVAACEAAGAAATAARLMPIGERETGAMHESESVTWGATLDSLPPGFRPVRRLA